MKMRFFANGGDATGHVPNVSAAEKRRVSHQLDQMMDNAGGDGGEDDADAAAEGVRESETYRRAAAELLADALSVDVDPAEFVESDIPADVMIDSAVEIRTRRARRAAEPDDERDADPADEGVDESGDDPDPAAGGGGVDEQDQAQDAASNARGAGGTTATLADWTTLAASLRGHSPGAGSVPDPDPDPDPAAGGDGDGTTTTSTSTSTSTSTPSTATATATANGSADESGEDGDKWTRLVANLRGAAHRER